MLFLVLIISFFDFSTVTILHRAKSNGRILTKIEEINVTVYSCNVTQA